MSREDDKLVKILKEEAITNFNVVTPTAWRD
jgi:hypothetical protein